ncbi:MAG: phosphoribosyltransferase [Thermoproteota archaeon]
MKKGTEFFVPTWNQLYKDIVTLSDKIKSSGYKPDIIVAIARGGWVVGRILSDLLDQPNVTDMHIKFYTDVAETLREPIIIETIGKDVSNKNVLIVDDVSDTGSSLKKACSYINESKPNQIKVATVYIKPWTDFIPDYYTRVIDKWIIYPYEVKETVIKIMNKFLSKSKNIEEIEKMLISAGIKKWQLRKIMKEISSFH